MTTATSHKMEERAKLVCPVCKTDMKTLPGNFKFEYEVEGMKKYSTPKAIFVCPNCGNVQQFVQLQDVRLLLE